VLADAELGALGGNVAGAKVGGGGVASIDDILHLVRSNQDRVTWMYGVPSSSVASAVIVSPLRIETAVFDSLVSLELDRLVDRGGLLAEKHVLQTGDRGVLTRDRNGETVLVEIV